MKLKTIYQYLKSKNIKFRYNSTELYNDFKMQDGNKLGIIIKPEGDAVTIVCRLYLSITSNGVLISTEDRDRFLDGLTDHYKTYRFWATPKDEIMMSCKMIAATLDGIEMIVKEAFAVAMDVNRVNDEVLEMRNAG